MKHRLREAKGPAQGHTAGERRSSPACQFQQVLSPAGAQCWHQAGGQRLAAGEPGRAGNHSPLFSPSRATAEPEAGGDYVKVRGAGQGTLAGGGGGGPEPVPGRAESFSGPVRSQTSPTVLRRRSRGQGSLRGLLSLPASSSQACHHSFLAPVSGLPNVCSHQTPSSCQLDRAPGVPPWEDGL